jgi:hypothetical protein
MELDFVLAPVFSLVLCQKVFARIPHLQLVLEGILVVQSIQTYPFDGGLDLTVCLKSQMVRQVSQVGLGELRWAKAGADRPTPERPFNSNQAVVFTASGWQVEPVFGIGFDRDINP